MKHLFIALCAFIISVCASAQTLVKEMDNANTRFIPGNYMKSGEAAIYFSSNEYGYDEGQSNYEAQIFDFELRPLKSFYFQILHPYTVTEQRVSNGTKELTKVINESRIEVYGLPSVSDMDARKDAFISWSFDENKYLDPTLTMESLTSACRVQGTTIYITLPKRTEYIQYAEYLKSIEVYFDASNQYGFNYTYATEVPVCNGEWTKSTWYDVPVSNFCTPKCTDVVGMNHWNGGVYLPFSQTFFNDDEKFEYVRYKAEIAEGAGALRDVSYGDNALQTLFGITDNDRDGDGEEDYRSTYFGVKRSGLEVVSEDGTSIYTFSLPETCEDNPSIEFFKSDNHILAQVDFNWRDENNNYIHSVRFYRIDKASGIAKVIREENHMSASPNPVSVGTPVRMTIPEGKHGNRVISVTSLNGTQVFSMQVEANNTEVSIPTHNLSSGVYLFSLTEGSSIIGNCKIIVR